MSAVCPLSSFLVNRYRFEWPSKLLQRRSATVYDCHYDCHTSLLQQPLSTAVCPSSPVTVFSFGTVACKAGHVRSHVVRRGDATPTATARATLVGNPPQRLHRRVGGWSGLAKMQLPLGTLFVARVYTHIDTNTHIHKHAYIRA